MALVTVNDVRQIIETNLSDAEVEAFINSADIIVSKIYENDTMMTPALKAEVEKWLTAHLIAVSRERQIDEISAGGAVSIKFQGNSGLGLESTLYGQNALLFDVSGKLSNLEKTSKGQAKLFVVGVNRPPGLYK